MLSIKGNVLEIRKSNLRYTPVGMYKKKEYLRIEIKFDNGLGHNYSSTLVYLPNKLLEEFQKDNQHGIAINYDVKFRLQIFADKLFVTKILDVQLPQSG